MRSTSSRPLGPEHRAWWGSHSRTSAGSSAISASETYGRVGHDHVDTTREVVGQRVEPRPGGQPHPGRRPAEAGQVGAGDGQRVGSEASVPHTSRPGRSAARARASAPEPVPRSTADAGVEPAALVERQLGQHLGLGPGDEDPAVDVQVERPEPPPLHGVLQGLARRPAGRPWRGRGWRPARWPGRPGGPGPRRRPGPVARSTSQRASWSALSTPACPERGGGVRQDAAARARPRRHPLGRRRRPPDRAAPAGVRGLARRMVDRAGLGRHVRWPRPAGGPARRRRGRR